jgi:hypothetical protein
LTGKKGREGRLIRIIINIICQLYVVRTIE